MIYSMYFIFWMVVKCCCVHVIICAHSYSVFLLQSDESIYERECSNMPGFAVYYRFPNSTRVTYGQFVKVTHVILLYCVAVFVMMLKI